jgi:hypothetical protein
MTNWIVTSQSGLVKAAPYIILCRFVTSTADELVPVIASTLQQTAVLRPH